MLVRENQRNSVLVYCGANKLSEVSYMKIYGPVKIWKHITCLFFYFGTALLFFGFLIRIGTLANEIETIEISIFLQQELVTVLVIFQMSVLLLWLNYRYFWSKHFRPTFTLIILTLIALSLLLLFFAKNSFQEDNSIIPLFFWSIGGVFSGFIFPKPYGRFEP